MSCLKLYWPQTLSLFHPAEEPLDEGQPGDQPVILSIRSRAPRAARTRQAELVNRARMLHENRICPECGRAAVVPVDARPLLATRGGMSVPCSGAIAGFECEACGHDWRV